MHMWPHRHCGIMYRSVPDRVNRSERGSRRKLFLSNQRSLGTRTTFKCGLHVHQLLDNVNQTQTQYLSPCLSVSLFVCTSVCPSAHSFVCLPACLPAFLSVCLSNNVLSGLFTYFLTKNNLFIKYSFQFYFSWILWLLNVCLLESILLKKCFFFGSFSFVLSYSGFLNFYPPSPPHCLRTFMHTTWKKP